LNFAQFNFGLHPTTYTSRHKWGVWGEWKRIKTYIHVITQKKFILILTLHVKSSCLGFGVYQFSLPTFLLSFGVTANAIHKQSNMPLGGHLSYLANICQNAPS